MTIPGQDFLEFQRQRSPAESDHPFNLFLVGDRHDAGFNRNADSSLGRFVEEIVKIVVIEEQLCNEFAGTGIDFDFQMFHVFCQCFGIGVAFGIAGADNVEFIPCLLTDKSDEVAGMGKYAFRFDTGRFITAQGQNIFNTVFPQFLQCIQHFLFIEIDAGQVCRCFTTQTFDFGSDFYGKISPLAAGSAGDADKIRMETTQFFQCRIDCFNRNFFFRWKDFKGKNSFLRK